MSWMLKGEEFSLSNNPCLNNASSTKDPAIKSTYQRKYFDTNGAEVSVTYMSPSSVSHLKDTEGKYYTKDRVKRMKFSDAIMDSLREDQMTGTCCDVTIQIEDQFFPAHRCVLKAKSDYFVAMFTGNFQEHDQKFLVLKAVPAEGFRVVIDFMYGRELKFTLDNISDVYKCADMMFVRDLIEECKIGVVNLFEPCAIINQEPKACVNDIMTLYNLAKILDLTKFMKTLVTSLRTEVLRSKGSREITLQLPVEVLTGVIKVDLKYCVARDINLIMFLVDWIKQNPRDRLRQAGPLFDQVRFAHVPHNLLCLTRDTIGDLCKQYKLKMEKLEMSKTLSSNIEQSHLKMESYKYLICLFSQDPVTLKGEVRVLEEDKTSWRRKEFVLQEIILQSVEIQEKLILLSYQSYYIVNLNNFEISSHEANQLLRFDQGYVACAQNDRLIIAGKSIYRCGRKECILVCDFHYWKTKPSLVQLFYFKTTENDVVAMSSSKKAIFVLTTTTTVPTSALIYVKHNAFMGYHSVDSFSINKENFSTRIFLDYNKNNNLFLMDSFNCDVMFSGVVIYLLNSAEVCDVWDRIANVESVDPVKTPDWIGVVKGTLLSNCFAKEGHLILGSQYNHLMLIRMNNMIDWKIHEVLPTFDLGWPILNYERTNFMIRSRES